MPKTIKTWFTVIFVTTLLNLTVVKSAENIETTKPPFDNTTGYDVQVENMTVPYDGMCGNV